MFARLLKMHRPNALGIRQAADINGIFLREEWEVLAAALGFRLQAAAGYRPEQPLASP